jgi:hypothetical protein
MSYDRYMSCIYLIYVISRHMSGIYLSYTYILTFLQVPDGGAGTGIIESESTSKSALIPAARGRLGGVSMIRLPVGVTMTSNLIDSEVIRPGVLVGRRRPARGPLPGGA